MKTEEEEAYIAGLTDAFGACKTALLNHGHEVKKGYVFARLIQQIENDLLNDLKGAQND